MKYYSFAGDSRGATDPDETFCINVHDEECTLRGCTKKNCEHMIIMWSGEEYSKDNTWIAVGEDHTINLDDAR